MKHHLRHLLFVAFITSLSTAIAAEPDARIRPYDKNPYYWQYKGKPVLLLGGSSEDNLFQIPNLEKELDAIAGAGGNYVRCTMSWRDEGDVMPFGKNGDKYDMNTWNPEFWDRFERFLKETAKRGIIVQIEVWATFDYYQDRWDRNPFQPNNNVNYSRKESGLPLVVNSHPTQTKNDFFRSVPDEKDLKAVLPYQEKLVAKMLEHSLKYDHVLYCMDNETSVTPNWGAYWSEFIKKKAAEMGKRVETTEMWDPWNLDHPMHNNTFDHPETYSFVDISQNNHLKGRKHYDNALTQRRRLARNPRPMNNVKTYGADTGRFGTTKDGVERFWRSIFAGCASTRFHRPDSGIGSSPLALRMIRSARDVTDAVDVSRCEPRPDLLSDCGENEAYCLAEKGKCYTVFFPDGGDVVLDVPKKGASVRWYNVEKGGWSKAEPRPASGSVRLKTPGKGLWVAEVEVL